MVHIAQTSTVAPLSRWQTSIHHAMVDLLARAGLEYSGGFVEAGGRRIHYLDYGPKNGVASDRNTVLLVHGGGAGGALWFRQIAALSEHFRVIAPDNPLFGLSDQTPVVAPIDDFAADYLLDFIDAMQLRRVNVAGLSLGGLGSLFLAIRHPERVSRLALLGAAGLGKDMPWIIRLISLPGLSNVFTMPIRSLHGGYFASHEVTRPFGPHAEDFKHYAFTIARNDGHGPALRRSVRVITGLKGQRRIISDEELASVRVPTLVIWGAKDKFFPIDHAHRAHRHIPEASLHILPEAGHVTPWDEPELVSELLTNFFSTGEDRPD